MSRDALVLRAMARRTQNILRARVSLDAFIEAVSQDDHGQPLVLAPMHRAWTAHVLWCWERGLRAMVLAHFGSGKSSTLAVPLLAWALGRDRNLRAKVITNDDAGARRRVGAVKRILESPTYQAVFPLVQRGGKWTEHELYLRRAGHSIDPSVHARGVVTTGIGGRADLEIFDDAVDQKNALDAAQRRKVKEFVDQTWLSRLEPDAKVLWISTVWHIDDAVHMLMQRPGWCALVQRVSDDCATIEQELVGGDATHPLLVLPALTAAGGA